MKSKKNGLLLAAVICCAMAVYMTPALSDGVGFLDAVRSGQFIRVQALLEDAADVNQRDDQGRTPLIIAVENEDISMVQILITWDAKVDAVDAWDRTALLAAAQKSNTPLVQLLLQAGADPDLANKNKITPLIAAVQRENPEAVTKIIDARAMVDAKDSLGRTALMWAAVRHNEAIVKLLLNHGADVQLRDNEQLSAADFAQNKNPDSPIVRLLQEWVPTSPSAELTVNPGVTQERVGKESFFSPTLDGNHLLVGNPDAPVTIVVYTDLQCPYCVVGDKMVNDVLEKYGKQVCVYIKSNPLTVHRQALLAAIYFQAVVHQDPDKALLFKNMVFAQQEELKKGEPFLQEIAAAVGVDREKLAEDVQSPLTRATIEADITEAGNFQFIGVPVFLVNGSPVYGVPVREELYRLIEAKLAQAKE